MNREAIEARVAQYYSERVRAHGATAAGADWNSEASQRLRFDQLMWIHGEDSEFSINDFGCGYGALAGYLLESGRRFSYCGFDISGPMLDQGRRRHEDDARIRFVASPGSLPGADYTVASGVLNVRGDVARETWEAYALEILGDLARCSRRGFAFNALTSHCDAERMRADLYYADPGFYLDHCLRRFSRRVAVLHDYPLYEFTVLVRKDEAAEWRS